MPSLMRCCLRTRPGRPRQAEYLPPGDPNADLFRLFPPLAGLLMGVEIEVNVLSFDGAPYVFHRTVTVALDVHHRSERVNAAVSGNRSFTGTCAGGRHTDFFRFPL
jgi:hypothetical protein